MGRVTRLSSLLMLALGSGLGLAACGEAASSREGRQIDSLTLRVERLEQRMAADSMAREAARSESSRTARP
jgi:hypothetical protein